MKFPLYSLKKKIACHPSTFVTKKVYDDLGMFKESFKYMMDVDLLMRLYKNNVVFKYVDYDLAAFRLGGTTSNSYKKKKDEVRRLYKENGAISIWAEFMVTYFLIYNMVANCLRKVINPDLLRKWKFSLIK